MAFIRSALATSNRTATSIPCDTESLVHLSLLKLKAFNSSTITYQTICVFRQTLASDGNGFSIRIKKNDFIVLEADANLVTSARNATNNCADRPNDWRANPTEMRRIKFLLNDLKEQLLQRRDHYVGRAKHLLAEISAKMNGAQALGIANHNVVAAQRARLTATASAKSIHINSAHGIEATSQKYATINAATQKLKEISARIKQNRDGGHRKRSIDEDITGETVTVKNLIVPNTNAWKGTMFYYYTASGIW